MLKIKRNHFEGDNFLFLHEHDTVIPLLYFVFRAPPEGGTILFLIS